MLSRIERIQSFVKNLQLSDLEKSTIIQDAIIRNLETLGLAAKDLPHAFKTERSQVKWNEIITVSKQLSQEIETVDLLFLWKTLHQILPPMKADLLLVLKFPA